jgi:hypothetical protein
MWQWLLEILGEILAVERHGNVRTYACDELAVSIAVSNRARRTIDAQGRRFWIWRDDAGLLAGDVAAPAQRVRFVRLRDEADRGAFEVMLDEQVDPAGFLILRKPWPLRGLSVYIKFR